VGRWEDGGVSGVICVGEEREAHRDTQRHTELAAYGVPHAEGSRVVSLVFHIGDSSLLFVIELLLVRLGAALGRAVLLVSLGQVLHLASVSERERLGWLQCTAAKGAAEAGGFRTACEVPTEISVSEMQRSQKTSGGGREDFVAAAGVPIMHYCKAILTAHAVHFFTCSSIIGRNAGDAKFEVSI
jgi:hypothetical protein